MFSSENIYTEIFHDLYPESEHIVIDAKRVAYNISATKIRMEGPFKHWDMLPRVVQPYFTKKVVIVGTESCGKSTLVRNLAYLYNTDYVEEYGRTFYEDIGDCEGVTLAEDYPLIAFEHKCKERAKTETARKVLFIDSEAIVTQYFCETYLGKHLDVLDQIASLQQYDLWLFLEPDVKWVDDGTRSFGQPSVREKNNLALKKLLDRHATDYKTIKGNYHERLNKAIEFVNTVLGITAHRN